MNERIPHGPGFLTLNLNVMQQHISLFLYALQNLDRRQECRENNPSHHSAKQYDKKRIQNLPDGIYVTVKLALQQIGQTKESVTSRSGDFHKRESMNDHIAKNISVFLQRSR